MRKSSLFVFLVLLISSHAYAEDSSPKKKKKLSLRDLISNQSSSQQTTTVAGVRGLDETGAEVDTQVRDYAAVDRINQVVVHEDELRTFISEGKLR